MGLADVHNVDFPDRATILHGDITAPQFVVVSNRYKLNDFNMGQILHRNKTNTSRNCLAYSFFDTSHKSRAPEQYRSPWVTEKADIYSFGNVLYYILHKELAYATLTAEEEAALVVVGKHPAMSQAVMDDTDPAIAVLRNVTSACYALDPEDRPSMTTVVQILQTTLEKLDRGRLTIWNNQWTRQQRRYRAMEADGQLRGGI
jgi:serine/threonine protein kinase